MAIKYIQADYHLSNSEFGKLFTIFTLGFGIGQFIAGFLADRYHPKILMIWGGFGAAAANVGFGLSGSMTWFSVFWGINALCLAMGWSPGCCILFHWIPPKRWGLFMGFFDAFAFLGGIIIYPIASFAIKYCGWRAAFFIPSALLAVWTVVFAKVVKNTPAEAGLTVAWSDNRPAEEIHLKDYLSVIRSKVINLVCIVAICSQFVRWGLVNWIVKILTESKGAEGFGLTLVTAAVIASAMHWGGAFFSIGMGYVSDNVFHGSRWQTIAIGSMVSAAALLAVYFEGAELANTIGGIVLLAVLLFLAGGCIQGVQAPIFNLPGDILGTRLGSTGVGIVNGWSYLGASFAGSSMGFVMDDFGLTSGMLIMSGVSLAGAIVISIVRR